MHTHVICTLNKEILDVVHIRWLCVVFEMVYQIRSQFQYQIDEDTGWFLKGLSSVYSISFSLVFNSYKNFPFRHSTRVMDPQQPHNNTVHIQETLVQFNLYDKLLVFDVCWKLETKYSTDCLPTYSTVIWTFFGFSSAMEDCVRIHTNC